MISPMPKVTIVGAGNVGTTLAQRVLYQGLADVVLLDIIEDRPQGLALDITESQPLEGFDCTVLGTNDYTDTAQSDIVVVAAGQPRQPGMSRADLVSINGKIVIDVVRQAIAASPEALLLVITNPLDVMCYLAWSVSGLPPARVMGMAGVLDAARLRTFIAAELGVPAPTVNTMVLGGHGPTLVPLLGRTSVGGIPIAELLSAEQLARLVERTRHGGSEVVKYLKTGGAFYAPAAAAATMIRAILHNQSQLLPVSTYVNGLYGLSDLFLGMPCRLGRDGIESIVELELSASEQTALLASAQSVQTVLDQARPLLASSP
ncbi:MAG: malate dehydrogenase [Cyanobacteria bacterium J06627_15]